MSGTTMRLSHIQRTEFLFILRLILFRIHSIMQIDIANMLLAFLDWDSKI